MTLTVGWKALGLTSLLVGLAQAYTNNIMLTGYWPPTNEMVRHFSTDPIKNPGGWQGLNWENRGYNIYSFFPEFNSFPSDRIGTGDFEVDYQDTSEDWWRITSLIRPVAIITFSRTDQFPRGWELELRQRNLAQWVNDYRPPLQPTPAPPDASVPADHIRLSTLPVQQIFDALRAVDIGVNPRIDTTDFGGGFLSEFIAYHGTWYQSLHSDPMDPFYTVAAGHIHVGGSLTLSQAQVATEITLRELIRHVDSTLGIPEPLAGLWVMVLWAVLRGRTRLQ